MDNKEIELKIKISQPEKLISFLETNAKFLGSFEQSDYYFDPPHKTFMLRNENDYVTALDYLRVRIHDNNTGSIGYKHFDKARSDSGFTYCDEVESSVSDPQNMRKILQFLEFKQSAVIKKQRKSYRYKEFQFELDEVAGLGSFVEIEYKGDAVKEEEGKQKILDILNEIGLKEWEEAKGGYVAMMWNRR